MSNVLHATPARKLHQSLSMIYPFYYICIIYTNIFSKKQSLLLISNLVQFTLPPTIDRINFVIISIYTIYFLTLTLYTIFGTQLCLLVLTLFVLNKSKRIQLFLKPNSDYYFIYILALEGASHPSSKLIVKMFLFK